MNLDDMKDRFGQIARHYDAQRRRFIPCYDDYYGMCIDFLASVISPPASVLDLGAGTGLVSKRFFDHYPDAHYTLVDVSEDMLAVAKERFAGLSHFQYIVADYSRALPNQYYDVICSGLSIHHLTDEDKQRLYRDVHVHLSAGGCFINLDQFNAGSAALNERFNQWWFKQIRESGLPPEEHEKWLKRRELDRENTIDETTAMLKQAGFETVECVYRYLKFGVVVGFKSARERPS